MRTVGWWSELDRFTCLGIFEGTVSQLRPALLSVAINQLQPWQLKVNVTLSVSIEQLISCRSHF